MIIKAKGIIINGGQEISIAVFYVWFVLGTLR